MLSPFADGYDIIVSLHQQCERGDFEMQILLDTANLAQIKGVLPYFPIDGVTTNPSILAREAENVKDTLLEIRKLLGPDRMIFAQATAHDSAGILKQAKELSDFIGPNFYCKIPITVQGLRAVEMCREAGLKTLVTAIFTPMQALLAAKAGADYVAPYVDRLDNITSDGAAVVGEIVRLYKNYGYATKVLAASFKNIQQVYNVAAVGTHGVTVSAQLCENLIFHPYTDRSLEDFDISWRSRFGDQGIGDLIK